MTFCSDVLLAFCGELGFPNTPAEGKATAPAASQQGALLPPQGRTQRPSEGSDRAEERPEAGAPLVCLRSRSPQARTVRKGQASA